MSTSLNTKRKVLLCILCMDLEQCLKSMDSLSLLLEVLSPFKFGWLQLHLTCQLDATLTLVQTLVKEYPELQHVRSHLGAIPCKILACCKMVNWEVQSYLLNPKNSYYWYNLSHVYQEVHEKHEKHPGIVKLLERSLNLHLDDIHTNVTTVLSKPHGSTNMVIVYFLMDVLKLFHHYHLDFFFQHYCLYN